MMLSVSGPFLLLYMLVLSGVLAILNARSVTVAGAVAATVAVAAVPSVLMAAVANATRTSLVTALLFIVIPALVMCAVSRLAIVRQHPWQMMLFGPLCFIVTVVVAATSFNVVQNSR